MASRNSQSERIREVLAKSMIPMDVENVRVRAGLKNWESTKAILLEMTLQGVIHGQKTTKSWIFWTNHSSTGLSAEGAAGEVPSFNLTPVVVARVETKKEVRR